MSPLNNESVQHFAEQVILEKKTYQEKIKRINSTIVVKKLFNTLKNKLRN